MASIRRRCPKPLAKACEANRCKHNYQLIYRARDGRQTSESFVRRKDAERRKSEVEVDLRNGTYIEPRAGRTTFRAWYDRWEPIRQISRSRRAADESLAKTHVLPRWERVPLDAITHMEVQAWVAVLAKRLAPASVGSCFGILKMALDAAVMEGKLRANPVLSVKIPPVRRPKITAAGVLTAAELKKLLAVVPERWRTMVALAGWLGLRWGEVIGLRRQDVNLFRHELYVGSVTIVEIKGTTSPQSGAKTTASVRTVPLPAPIESLLRDYMAAYCAEAAPDGFLFLTTDGTHPLRGNFRRKVLMPALKKAGLSGRGITFHRLRHTSASLMLDAGLSIQDVSERLGHARPSITYDVYAHLLDEKREKGTAALAALIEESAG
jgi:integrase